jgi:hypothetical protein
VLVHIADKMGITEKELIIMQQISGNCECIYVTNISSVQSKTRLFSCCRPLPCYNMIDLTALPGIVVRTTGRYIFILLIYETVL